MLPDGEAENRLREDDQDKRLGCNTWRGCGGAPWGSTEAHAQISVCTHSILLAHTMPCTISKSQATLPSGLLMIACRRRMAWSYTV